MNFSGPVEAEEGFDVEMLDDIGAGNGLGIKEEINPDFLIDGKAYDCYAPQSSKSGKVIKKLQHKSKYQTHNIVLNLDDYKGDVDELLSAINRKKDEDLRHVEEVIVIKDEDILEIIKFER